nr:juvenile hormone acid methyltransferase-8 [Pardosa pseudoannulata]
MNRNSRLYDTNKQLQIKDSTTFLENFVRRMDWSRQDSDVIMDIGCGPSGVCDTFCLSTFPRLKKFIGVDISENMIELAKEKNEDQRVEYHIADIENKDTVEKWFQQITKVISIYCLHWTKNLEEASRNIYNLLKPGGEAALLIAVTCNTWDCYESLYSNPKWNKYIKDVYSYVPESHHNKYGIGYFSRLFEKVGFKVLLAEYQDRKFTFENDKACKEMWYVLCAFTNHIPIELKEDFTNDLFKGFLKYNERNSEGKPVMIYSSIEILLQKPLEKTKTKTGKGVIED